MIIKKLSLPVIAMMSLVLSSCADQSHIAPPIQSSTQHTPGTCAVWAPNGMCARWNEGTAAPSNP